MAKKRKKAASTSKTDADFGTAQLHSRQVVRLERASNSARRARVLDQTALDKLFLDDEITEEEFDAGERLRGDLFRAQMMGVPGSNPNRTTQAHQTHMSDRQATAMYRVAYLLGHVNEQLGAPAEDALLNLLLYDHQITQPSLLLSCLRSGYENWSGRQRSD